LLPLVVAFDRTYYMYLVVVSADWTKILTGSGWLGKSKPLSDNRVAVRM
jgi:hypothetical protein